MCKQSLKESSVFCDVLTRGERKAGSSTLSLSAETDFEYDLLYFMLLISLYFLLTHQQNVILIYPLLYLFLQILLRKRESERGGEKSSRSKDNGQRLFYVRNVHKEGRLGRPRTSNRFRVNGAMPPPSLVFLGYLSPSPSVKDTRNQVERLIETSYRLINR